MSDQAVLSGFVKQWHSVKEEYIETIKLKFNCDSKSQLFSKAIALGYVTIKNI